MISSPSQSSQPLPTTSINRNIANVNDHAHTNNYRNTQAFNFLLNGIVHTLMAVTYPEVFSLAR